MNDLIEALTILKTYLKDPNKLSPTHCEHDILYIMDVSYEEVSDEDKKRLEELGFLEYEEGWASFRFGSA